MGQARPWSWGVGEPERALTGDATARRCSGANIPPDPKRATKRKPGGVAGWGTGDMRVPVGRRDATGTRSGFPCQDRRL